jgi:DNA-binding transcriptional ArsR family regulator
VKHPGFRTRCDNCGRTGVLAAMKPCPECRAKQVPIRPEDTGATVTKLPGGPTLVRFESPAAWRSRDHVRVIPRRVRRTERATRVRTDDSRKKEERACALRAQGRLIREIATDLDVTPRTVSRYLSRARDERPS